MDRVFLIGFMGAGKTTIGKALAQIINYRFFDIDDLVEQKTGKTISDIFDKNNEEEFRKFEQQALKEIINEKEIVVATGGGTPCFNNNLELIKQAGISVYLKQPSLMLYYRLRNSKNEYPLLKDVSYSELMPYINKLLRKRKPFYKQADIIIQYNSSPVEEITQKLLEELYSLGLRIAPPTTSSNAE